MTKKNSIQEKKKKARNQVFDQAIDQEKKSSKILFFSFMNSHLRFSKGISPFAKVNKPIFQYKFYLWLNHIITEAEKRTEIQVIQESEEEMIIDYNEIIIFDF